MHHMKVSLISLIFKICVPKKKIIFTDYILQMILIKTEFKDFKRQNILLATQI